MRRKRRRIKIKPVHHLWEVEVRHRDYLATANARETGVIYMKHSTLFIEAVQPAHLQPSIDWALARTRAFLNRHRREYGLPGIQNIIYQGTIDK